MHPTPMLMARGGAAGRSPRSGGSRHLLALAHAGILGMGGLCAGGACGCANGPHGGGLTSTALVSAASSTAPPPAASSDTPSATPAPVSSLPVVATPPLPGNVPLGSVWMPVGAVTLFGSDAGPTGSDATYNQLGSIVLTADLAMVAAANPNFIASHIALVGQTDAARPVYEITLYDPVTHASTPVRVDDLLLADANRNPLDGLPLSAAAAAHVIWPALYTKALALVLGGYTSNFNGCVPRLCGVDFAPLIAVNADSQPAGVAGTLQAFTTGLPIRVESLTVSEGQVITSPGPVAPNVTVEVNGPVFVCTDVAGARAMQSICLQATTLYDVVDVTPATVTLRNIYATTAGSAFDGLYGYRPDGSTTMPLAALIDLAESILPLAHTPDAAL